MLFDQGKLWVGDWSGENVVIRNNLYYNESGSEMSFPFRGKEGRPGATFAPMAGTGS